MVTFFVRHAALVRPLSQIGTTALLCARARARAVRVCRVCCTDASTWCAGTLKLAGDMAQMELALAPIHPLKDLGGPYKELRALRPLIFRFERPLYLFLIISSFF